MPRTVLARTHQDPPPPSPAHLPSQQGPPLPPGTSFRFTGPLDSTPTQTSDCFPSRPCKPRLPGSVPTLFSLSYQLSSSQPAPRASKHISLPSLDPPVLPPPWTPISQVPWTPHMSRAGPPPANHSSASQTSTGWASRCSLPDSTDPDPCLGLPSLPS